jgi:O-antigen ligase/tetratricopeptide (TPR) repeat protein
MEAVLLALVCLSPWAYGAVHPGFTFLLYAGVAVLLVLWAVRLLLDGEFTWKKCPVVLCLAGLFLSAGWQLTPLSPGVLAQLAPHTADLYRRLLPAQPEVLPAGETRDAVLPPPGSTLSLYPAATRQELVKLLAVVLVFAVVRNNLTSVAALRRLAVVVLVNGVLLSLFALVQFFTSSHDTLYWTYPSLGQVFGPFINRNHFALYMNLCLGLGLGLLLYRSAGEARARHESRPGLLHDPLALWLCAAVALLLGTIVFSLSRGGALALAGGVAVALLARPVSSLGSLRLRALALTLALGLGLVVWFGFQNVEARFASLWQSDTSRELRLDLWARCLQLANEFPVWGTGLGTFVHVEPLSRTAVQDVSYVHAENEYVEALVEGGVVRLLVAVATIVLMFVLGYRALRRCRGERSRGLVVGLLFAFTTLVVHSSVDFGVHVPAIALLAAVLCAHLSALGAGNPADGPETEGYQPDAPARDTSPTRQRGTRTPLAGASGWYAPGQYTLRLGGLAPVLGAVTVVVLGLVLVVEGWKAQGAQQLRSAALRAGGSEALAHLEGAARLAPDLADLQTELAQAHLDAFEEETGRVQEEGKLLEFGRTVGALTASGTAAGPAGAALALAPTGLGLSALRPAAVTRGEEAAHRHLVPALRHLLRARDLCPLLPQPHVRLAANVRVLARADSRLTYLERALFVARTDPWLWYLCGLQELAESNRERAWKDWRHSLDLSDRYLALIVEQSARILGPDGVADQVLPERPAVLLAGAHVLYPGPEATEKRRPLLERALAGLQGERSPVKAEDFRVKALIHAGLGQREQADTCYQAALVREPNRTGWRLEYARLLLEERRLEDARHQLLLVLAQEPGNGPARALLDQVARLLAETR